jgi:alkyl hydroperoxide reductase subunit AhpC
MVPALAFTDGALGFWQAVEEVVASVAGCTRSPMPGTPKSQAGSEDYNRIYSGDQPRIDHLARDGAGVMTLAINDTAPDFEAQTTEGRIKFHDWIGNSWAVLFSHPKDFTPVCTTELGYMAKIRPEFDKRGVKIIGLSVDPIDRHAGWASDIKETQGFAPNYPMIGDTDFNVSKLYGMLPAAVSGDPATRTAADNQTVRNVFVIGPDKKIKLILVYPMTTGRNFDEVLRVIDSLQLTAKHKVATPVNWKHGDDVIIAGSVSDEDAKKQYPQGWKAPKPYIRIVPQPKG